MPAFGIRYSAISSGLGGGRTPKTEYRIPTGVLRQHRFLQLTELDEDQLPGLVIACNQLHVRVFAGVDKVGGDALAVFHLEESAVDGTSRAAGGVSRRDERTFD